MKKDKDPIQVITFREAARDARTTADEIKRLAREKVLDVVRLPGRKRPSGVTRTSLDKLLRSSIVQ